GARAAAGEAHGRHSCGRFARGECNPSTCVSRGAKYGRLCRGPEHQHRISMGGGVHRSAAGACGTFRRGASGRTCNCRRHVCGTGGEGGDGEHSNRRLVASLNRPGGNVTGVTSLNIEVAPKRLELLHELLPSVTTMGLLVNPAVPALAAPVSRISQAAAHSLGLQLHVVHASSDRDFDAVFEKLIQLHAGALVIGPDNLFTAHSEQLAMLTVRHALPAVYEFREFAAAGGLMSYGSSEMEYYRLVGTYAGRVLKGDKPANLPVQQSTKVELFLNLKTAKALGIEIPPSLLARADPRRDQRRSDAC